MLPLDTVRVHTRDGQRVSEVQSEGALGSALQALREADVQGVMVDVWWGIAERDAPGRYDFAAYRRLFCSVAAAGLRVQAVMSFHAAGTNVGDTCTISLPPWVLAAGAANPDIFYTDRAGYRNHECLSTGCLLEPVLAGRTPLRAYSEFIAAFCAEFEDFMGDVISEIVIGMGPAGELRYPSYPEGDRRWRFPGVGEFQCYDKYLLASLRDAANAVGRPDWGSGGPHDAGTYNSRFWETAFFRDGGGWDSPYGRFFLLWYSDQLLRHADLVLGHAARVLGRMQAMTVASVKQEAEGAMTYCFAPRRERVALGIKLAGVHWCSKSHGHGAELTAGYYTTARRNGYAPIMRLLARHAAHVSFTCVEMRDCEHPAEGACGPEALLRTVIETAAAAGVPLTGENALQRYDQYAFERMCQSAMGASARSGSLQQLTFLRMGDLMFDNWAAFRDFIRAMRRCPRASGEHGNGNGTGGGA